jgi:hypothetical protein
MIYATNTIHGAKGRIDRLSMSSSKACCPSWLQPLSPLVVLTCQNVVFTCQDVVLTCQDLQWCTTLIARKMAAVWACRIHLRSLRTMATRTLIAQGTAVIEIGLQISAPNMTYEDAARSNRKGSSEQFKRSTSGRWPLLVILPAGASSNQANSGKCSFQEPCRQLDQDHARVVNMEDVTPRLLVDRKKH